VGDPMLVILWFVLVLSGLLGLYFGGTAQEDIRQLMPLEFQRRDIYSFYIRDYAFSSWVPLEIQRKYFLQEVFFVVATACIAALFASYGKYVLLLLFAAVTAYQSRFLVQDFRRLLKARHDAERRRSIDVLPE
jgi:hypothetical protein